MAVVYVDPWADAARDPGILIAEAIGRALQPHLGVVDFIAHLIEAQRHRHRARGAAGGTAISK